MLVKLNRITVPLLPQAVSTAPENHRCHAVSNRMITNLMVVSQPLSGSRHRRIKMLKRVHADYFRAAGSNQISWIHTNPHTGSLLHAVSLSEKQIHIERNLISHDVIGGPGQFIAQNGGQVCC